MTCSLKEIPIEQLEVEHYLFDLGYPVWKVSEILALDKEYVRKIHDEHIRYLDGKETR